MLNDSKPAVAPSIDAKRLADATPDPGLTVAELNAIVVVLRSRGWHASAYDLKAIDEAVIAVRRGAAT